MSVAPPEAAEPQTRCAWRLATPTAVPGGLAVIELRGDLAWAFHALNITPVPVGAVARRSLAGVDTGVVARWEEAYAQLMPHGGPVVVRALTRKLLEAGMPEERAAQDPRRAYPEAQDVVEARMLAALARAASPLAIDLLLDQPARWRAHAAGGPGPDLAHSRRLNYLLDAPLVVLAGPANVGKSTLTNTLAGSSVSIVSDEPGTTRDHVGVLIDMAGLVVRWVDTPGVRADADTFERDAAVLAAELAGRADLLVVVGDATAPPPELPASSAPRLRVQTRRDMAPAGWPQDLAVSAYTGEGISVLVHAVRDRLVPQDVMDDPRPWRFWHE